MGTHPIFESDFDCLTETSDSNGMSFQLAHVAAELIGENDLLKRVFFASCCAFERVYFHGGCLEPEGKLPQPLGDVLLFDAKTMSIGRVESQTPAPRLCKHEMSAIGHRLLIVGGWDGYKRRSGLTFDVFIMHELIRPKSDWTAKFNPWLTDTTAGSLTF